MIFISSQKLFSFSRYLDFCLDFLVIQKKRFHQKDKINFKIQDVANLLPNISRSKENQAIKFGRLIEYSNRNNLFKNHEENEAGRLVPDFFLFFKKNFYEVKANGLQLRFNIFRQPSAWYTIKINCVKRQIIGSEVMVNFEFWEKRSGNSFCTFCE